MWKQIKIRNISPYLRAKFLHYRALQEKCKIIIICQKIGSWTLHPFTEVLRFF